MKDEAYKFQYYVVELDGVQSHPVNAHDLKDALGLIGPGQFFDCPTERREEAIVYGTDRQGRTHKLER